MSINFNKFTEELNQIRISPAKNSYWYLENLIQKTQNKDYDYVGITMSKIYFHSDFYNYFPIILKNFLDYGYTFVPKIEKVKINNIYGFDITINLFQGYKINTEKELYNFLKQGILPGNIKEQKINYDK